MNHEAQFRLLPSVDEMLRSSEGQRLLSAFPRSLVVRALRAGLGEARSLIRSGSPCPSLEELFAMTLRYLEQQQFWRLQPVINATGVILHTNLGRAPLSLQALEAVRRVAGGYVNLEYDLETGERGSRHAQVAGLLRELTGAEDALVVNNNAAAVLLALSTLAGGREVVISRGQLVEIGGGFRVPDVMLQSGCRLVEVGTTNRTRLADYQGALGDQTALLLSVHPSNFRITGFTESPSLAELAELAHRHDLFLMEDQGSGCLLSSEQFSLAHEPMPQESLAAGADVVCFSGDKLLGGPQAGILVGRGKIIARIARHPLMRALRCDKMTLAALEATLRHYQRGEALTHIPIWRMIALEEARIVQRANNWCERLRAQGIPSRLLHGESTIGGGSLPGETLPTMLLALDADRFALSLAELARRLRSCTYPVVARIQRDALLLDPRTVLDEQDDEVIRALLEVLR